MKESYNGLLWAGIVLLCLLFLFFSAALFSPHDASMGEYGTYPYGIGMTAGYSDGDSIWAHAFGGDSVERAYSVLETYDGNYLVAGSIQSGITYPYAILVSADGDCLDGIQLNREGYCQGVVETSDGYVLSGTYGKITPAPGYQFFAAKIDRNLDSVWFKTYGGDTTEYNYGIVNAYATPDSGITSTGFVLFGSTRSFGTGIPTKNNMWMLFIDNDGDSVRQRVIPYTGNYNEYSKVAKPICRNEPSSGYVCVFAYSPTTNRQARCLATTVYGDSLWGRDFGKLASSYVEGFYSVVQSRDGGFAMAGMCEAPAGQPYSRAIYFGRVSPSGDSILTTYYEGDGSNKDVASIVETPDNNFIIGGWIDSERPWIDADFFLLKVDSTGDSLWMHVWGSTLANQEEFAYDNIITSRGDYVIVGITRGYGANPGTENIWVLKVKGED